MDMQLNLKDLERQVFRSTFEDGLLDIYLGLLLLGTGSGFALHEAGLSVPLTLVAMLALAVAAYGVFWAGKRYLTLPRIGQVRLGPGGRARRKKATAIGIASVIAGMLMLVVILALRGTGQSGFNPVLFIMAAYIINMVVVFSIGAYVLSLDRLYVIGLLYALPFPALVLADELAGIRLGYAAAAIPAALIVVMGLAVLARFVRRYPAADIADAADGGQ